MTDADKVIEAIERWKAHDWGGPVNQYGLPEQAYKDMLAICNSAPALARDSKALEMVRQAWRRFAEAFAVCESNGAERGIKTPNSKRALDS